MEELMYNSLDAGATKVFVALVVGTCYIKVKRHHGSPTVCVLKTIQLRSLVGKYHHRPSFRQFLSYRLKGAFFLQIGVQ
ncbi:hypothetical protein ACET3Z_018724 [Daucus carota]